MCNSAIAHRVIIVICGTNPNVSRNGVSPRGEMEPVHVEDVQVIHTAEPGKMKFANQIQVMGRCCRSHYWVPCLLTHGYWQGHMKKLAWMHCWS